MCARTLQRGAERIRNLHPKIKEIDGSSELKLETHKVQPGHPPKSIPSIHRERKRVRNGQVVAISTTASLFFGGYIHRRIHFVCLCQCTSCEKVWDDANTGAGLVVTASGLELQQEQSLSPLTILGSILFAAETIYLLNEENGGKWSNTTDGWCARWVPSVKAVKERLAVKKKKASGGRRWTVRHLLLRLSLNHLCLFFWLCLGRTWSFFLSLICFTSFLLLCRRNTSTSKQQTGVVVCRLNEFSLSISMLVFFFVCGPYRSLCSSNFRFSRLLPRSGSFCWRQLYTFALPWQLQPFLWSILPSPRLIRSLFPCFSQGLFFLDFFHYLVCLMFWDTRKRTTNDSTPSVAFH